MFSVREGEDSRDCDYGHHDSIAPFLETQEGRPEEGRKSQRLGTRVERQAPSHTHRRTPPALQRLECMCSGFCKNQIQGSEHLPVCFPTRSHHPKSCRERSVDHVRDPQMKLRHWDMEVSRNSSLNKKPFPPGLRQDSVEPSLMESENLSLSAQRRADR